MDQEQVKDIAKTAAKEALSEFMLILGVNVENKDSIISLNQDLNYIRSIRTEHDNDTKDRADMVRKGVLALIGASFTAAFAYILGHK